MWTDDPAAKIHVAKAIRPHIPVRPLELQTLPLLFIVGTGACFGVFFFACDNVGRTQPFIKATVSKKRLA